MLSNLQTMNFPKIALKSDSTIEGGRKVIDKLKSLGADNPNCLIGYGSGYYYIDSNEEINTSVGLPTGYTLVTLEQKQKLFKLI